MTKQVRETAAGQSISASVILNKKGEHVATVQAHYSNAGRVTVDVWSTSVGLEGMCERADLWAKLPTDKDYKAGAFDLWSLQQGSAGGYGYDKHAAALAGLIIDGHTIADHCGQVPEAEKARVSLMRAYRRAVVGNAVKTPAARDGWQQKAKRIGCHFANWQQDADGCEGWGSLHFDQGLARLESLGYTVINAI
jgi:hypothetical protein